MSVIKSDLELHKSQLSEFLSKKYVDQPMLLGFTVVVQSKFYKWIQEDIELNYASAGTFENAQKVEAEFSLAKLLQILWAQFFHPIVKFYQRQHAELLSLLLSSAKSPKKEFKVVEMRKINEYFTKFVKCVTSFYTKILEYVMNTFPNPVITDSLFQELEIPMCTKDTPAPSTDFISSTMLVLYHCLLGLGNITRHFAHMDTTYVQPSKSYSKYQKFTNKVIDPKAKQAYVKPLLYYSKCIQLFPHMSEAYNHIGVIYNTLNQKPKAVIWFLRSQFTPDRGNVIGKYNLATIFRKTWLEAEYARAMKRHADEITTEDLQIILLRIMGHLFYPEAYKKPLYCDKTSVDFITKTFFHPTPRPFVRDADNITDTLTTMMCFYLLAEVDEAKESATKCGSLLHRFIINYLKHVCRWSAETRDDTGILKNVRFILAFCNKVPSILEFGKEDIISALYGTICAFLDTDEETKAKILLAFNSDKKPFRFYLFAEDVKFKQFVPIGSRFHDFDDSHLLKSGDVNLLLGPSFADLQTIPAFLDNSAVQRINKDAELDGGNRQQAIYEEVTRLENYLRLQSIVFISNIIFPDRFSVDDDALFNLEKVDIPATQTQNVLGKISNRTEKKKEGKRDKSDQSGRKKKSKSLEANTIDPVVTPPKFAASLDEIELMILGHASGFGTTPSDGVSSEESHVSGFGSTPSGDISTEGGLANMVNSILSENDGKESQGSLSKPASVAVTPVDSSQPTGKMPKLFTPTSQPYQTPLQMPSQPMATPSMPVEHFAPGTPAFGYNAQGYYGPIGYPYYPPIGQMGQPLPMQPVAMGPAMGQPAGRPMAQHIAQPAAQSPVGVLGVGGQPFFPPAPWQYDPKGHPSNGQGHQYQLYPQYQS